MTKAKVFNVDFIKKEQLTEEVFSFYFAKNDFDYAPGQYIQITLPHDDPDEEGSSRYFTLASSPTEKAFVMITTRLRQSSFKKALFRLKKGESVQAFGPIGKFVLEGV